MFRDLLYKSTYRRGKDVTAASALTCDMSGDYFHVGGSTPITSINNMGKGKQIVLEFDDACTVVHDATALILPNGVDISCSAGDTLRLVQYDDNNYWKAIGGSAFTNSGSGDFTSSKSSASLGWRVDNNGDFTSDLSDWTAGAGWAWTSADAGAAEHTAGNTATLEGTADVLEGVRYYGEFTVSNRTAGSMTISIDGSRVYSIVNDSYLFGLDGTYTFGYTAEADGTVDIVITPSTGFDGRITSVKVYNVSAASPAITIYDDTATEACDIMADDDLDNLFMGANSGLNAYTGDRNICYGKDAGESLVVGSNNSFFGKDTGEDCTSGHFNVGIGADALSKATTGSCNTAIGTLSGTAITDGLRNTLIGYQSGAAITTGYDNTLVGPKAGRVLTTGYSNVCVGPRAGEEISGDLNIYIGDRAGRDAGSGDRNIGIGYETFVSATTASNNIGIGYRPGWYITEGAKNVLIGDESGYDITTGDYNVGVGYRSLYNITTSDNNIALGNEAGYTMTTGTENICIGSRAGYGIVDDSYNICIGIEAGEALSVGDYNVLIGRYSCENGTGESNIIIGDEARRNGTGSANENVIIGDSAAKDLTTGSNNVLIGNHAADNLLATDGNVIIGDEAAVTSYTAVDNTSAVNCVLIGKGAKTYGASDSNNIIIGYNATALAASNTTIIGNGNSGVAMLWGQLQLPSGQIRFPSTQVASVGANDLDDYEEGTFTPVLKFGGGTTGITYDTQSGRYTKIGNRVIFDIHIDLSSKGSSTGVATITGLPFTAGHDASVSVNALFLNLSTQIQGHITSSGSTVYLTSRWSSTADVTNSGFLNTTILRISGSYSV